MPDVANHNHPQDPLQKAVCRSATARTLLGTPFVMHNAPENHLRQASPFSSQSKARGEVRLHACKGAYLWVCSQQGAEPQEGVLLLYVIPYVAQRIAPRPGKVRQMWRNLPRAHPRDPPKCDCTAHAACHCYSTEGQADQTI